MILEDMKSAIDDGLKALNESNENPVQRTIQYREIQTNATLDESSAFAQLLKERDALPAHLIEDRARRARWARMFTGEKYKGNKNSAVRRATEIVLDNVWRECVTEYSPMMPELRRMDPVKMLLENTTTSTIAAFVTTALRTARRWVPEVMYNNLVGVIPTTQPDTKVPFLKRIYDNSVVGGATAGNEVHPYAGSSYDSHYSGSKVYGEPLGLGDGGTQNFDMARSPTYNHEVYIDGVPTTAFTVGVGAGGGGVDRIQFAAPPALNQILVVNYDTMQEGDAAHRLRMQLDMMDVNSDFLSLGHIWSLKAEQNMTAYHGLDVLSENLTMLAEELNQTLDSSVLMQILNQATGAAATFDSAGYLPGDTTSEARKAYERRLYDKMVEVSTDLFDLHRVWPTYFACGTGLAERLRKLENFTVADRAYSGMESGGRMVTQQRSMLGVVGNSWMIYADPKLPTNKGFFGWPGMPPYRTNFALTMFLPFWISPRIWNSTLNLESGQVAVMRCGRKMVDGTQFGTLEVV